MLSKEDAILLKLGMPLDSLMDNAVIQPKRKPKLQIVISLAFKILLKICPFKYQSFGKGSAFVCFAITIKI